MTVALGLVCSDGVLVASDSMASEGRLASTAVKVHSLPKRPIVWTASGSVFVIEEAANQLSNLEAQIAQNPGVETAFNKPDLPVIRHGIGELVF
jgi:20S proteasome alpha/beta subunit